MPNNTRTVYFCLGLFYFVFNTIAFKMFIPFPYNAESIAAISLFRVYVCIIHGEYRKQSSSYDKKPFSKSYGLTTTRQITILLCFAHRPRWFSLYFRVCVCMCVCVGLNRLYYIIYTYITRILYWCMCNNYSGPFRNIRVQHLYTYRVSIFSLNQQSFGMQF